MGGPTGTGISEARGTPALALIDLRGEVVRLTETFRAGFVPEASPHLVIWDVLADPDQRSRLGGVLEGRSRRVDLALPSPSGSVAAEAEAVIDANLTRYALLTVAPADPDAKSRSGADILLEDRSLDDSPAIVWIKDLRGRYLRINRRYTEHLGIDAAAIAGKTDADVGPAHVVDEPRLRGHAADGSEPAQLEYTVEPAHGRPGLTVLRFPLHRPDGGATAVCGVASTVADAAVARSEAERLLRIERWAGLSVTAIRSELFEEWELAEVPPAEPVGEATPGPAMRAGAPERLPASAAPAAAAAAASLASAAELERLRHELAAARVATADLESILEAERLAKSDLDTRLTAAAARSEKLDEEVAAATRRADELVSDVATGSSRLAELEARVAAERARAEAAEREVAAARERPGGSELEAALEIERARAEAAEREAAVARTCAERAERETAAARARVQGAEREIAAARARVAELKDAHATASVAREQSAAERTARPELEQRVVAARRRAEEAERSLAAERAAGGRAHGELIARAERAEAAMGEAHADAERAAVAAKRASAAAELSRGRAEGLEAELQRAREGEAESRAELQHARAAKTETRAERERARAEIVSLQRALEAARAESESAREAGHEITRRVERERVERELREREPVPAEPAMEPLVRAPSVRLVGTGVAEARPSSSGPSWSHSAQRALTASLAGSAEWRTGLKDALRVLGTEGGWDVAIAWCPDERARTLRCVAMWMSASDELGLFETATWQRRQSPTASEAGRVAAGDHGRWLDDLGAVDDAQLVAAAGEGMRSALLVPIRYGEVTSGVLELLTRAAGAATPETASAMEAVALQLAHFEYLLRQGAEPRWRIGRM